MNRLMALLSTCLFLGLALGACVPMPASDLPTAAPPPATAMPQTPSGTLISPLIGTTWLLQSYGPTDALQSVPPEAQVTLTFTDEGQVNGLAACNRYSGPVTVTDEAIAFGALAQTEMACAEPLMALERAYLDALARVVRFELTGNQLTLHSNGGVLIFLTAPAPGLTSTSWELIAIGVGDTLTSPVGNTGITATFTDDGQVSGAAGCNRYFGSVTVAGDRITFGMIATTKMACAEEIMTQEQAFVELLGQVTNYTLDGNRLILYADGGNRTLIFEGGAD